MVWQILQLPRNRQETGTERRELMLNLETKKEKEIKKMTGILSQMKLEDILLLSRDANTLLTRQRIVEADKEKKAG